MLFFLTLLLLFSSKCSSQNYEEEYYYQDDETPSQEGATTPAGWAARLAEDVVPKGASPPYNDTEKVNVLMVFSTFDHISLDQENQMLEVSGRFCLVWNDQRLSWNPSEYGGIRDLHVSLDKIWYPQFRTPANRYLNENLKTSKDTIHIYVFASELVYLTTCPQFVVKVGCAIDMSRYPFDEHSCHFMLSVVQWEHVNLNLNNINKQQAAMRFLLTRYETRATAGEFTVVSINSTKKWVGGLKVYDSPDKDFPRMPVAYQLIVLKRHYNNFLPTVAMPAMTFTSFNIVAAITPRVEFSVSLYLFNIFMMGLFFRDAVEKFPLYFSRTPDIVLHLYVSLSMAIAGFFYLSIRELVRQNNGTLSVTERFPKARDTKEWQDVLLKKIFSFDFLVLLISLVTTVWYIL